MSENTTTAINLKPRWWQFILRFRAWRERRVLIGMTIIFNGEPMTIVDFSDDNIVTIDEDHR